MSELPPSLVWFSQDLRLADNPALAAAIERGGPVIPVYIWAPQEEGAWPPGAASRWWVHQSLTRLAADLEDRGSRLVVRRGPATDAILTLAAETGARAVFWNRRYEPAAIAREADVEAGVRHANLDAAHFNGSLLFDPSSIRNSSGEPFRVFSAFWRACMKHRPREPLAAPPDRVAAPARWPASLPVSDLKLEPAIDWAAGFREWWRPGEGGAHERLRMFRRDSLASYSTDRDRPDRPGVSRLSPHLHFGEVSPNDVWRAVMSRMRDNPRECEAFLRQLVWREFGYHLLCHFPDTAEQSMRAEFGRFPWRMRREWFDAWKHGRTGYPLVDAGMRQLWQTGWMHNRVRMIAASFLVKHLLIPWQEGAKWFWDTLVDADLANNTLGWQWVAGCGADAAPYFRIFNPALQASKFDPFGDYVKRWVPEAGQSDYPSPIVQHAEARTRALEAWQTVR